jgi:SNF2 family DNA or RNA helicase
MTFKGELRPFQVEGVQRMIDRRRLLVSYHMGLGKTIISIAAIEQLIDEANVTQGFVIAAKSLKRQWRDQINLFTGGEAQVQIVDGSSAERHKAYVAYANDEVEYLILNIEQVVNDWDVVSKLPRDFIVADEVQFAKNFKPQRSKKLKKLHAEYRWGLTGQPIENRAEDLFSIMEWVDPSVLGDWATFDTAFIKRDPWGNVRRYVNLPTLHNVMGEAMIRKTRAEVADQMPNLVEESILVDFDISGSKLYRIIQNDLEAALEEAVGLFGGAWDPAKFYGGGDANIMQAQGQIMSKLVCLRMLCDHPELLRRSAARFRGDPAFGGIKSGSQYAADLGERGLLSKQRGHPKLDAFKEEITTILDENSENKIVVFSFFKDMLDLISAEIPHTNPVLFTGSMTSKARDVSKQTFTHDPKCRVFLSSDAGGVGLDLPMANYLISYDLPDSAGKWQQRNSRIDRLSSKFSNITVLSFLMSDSIEERQYDSLKLKEAVSAAVLDGKGWDKQGGMKLDLQTLRSFLSERAV